MRNVRLFPFLTIATWLIFTGCTEDVDFKGRVRLSISGSVADDPTISGINLIISGLEAKKDGRWRALRSFDQPVGVNLTKLVGGQSFTLLEQFIDPGLYTEFRVSVLMADLRSEVLRSPVSTVDFNGGVSRPIFLPPGETAFTFPAEMQVSERGMADYNLVVDVRKAVLPAQAQAFSFVPAVRLVNLTDAGTLSGRLLNTDGDEALRVFVYEPSGFAGSETEEKNGVRFARAMESAGVRVKRFQVGFLPAGTYDLVFAKVDGHGRFAGLRGVVRGVDVAARQTALRDFDINGLSDR